MRAPLSFVALTVALCGCATQDPFDRLMTEVGHEDVPSYLYVPIDLPATASPDQLISTLSKLGEFSGMQITSYKILEVRRVQDKTFRPPDDYTAVQLRTNLGQRFVLLRPEEDGHGWYYKVYELQ